MPDNSVHVDYNKGLEPLEKLLESVQRPGDFSTHGTVEIPMPKVEIEGVGVLSFPVPEAQVQELIQQASRAPYGRGEKTILDESVRKVWQLPPDKVRIGGRSWAASFGGILRQVVEGLGCETLAVSTELYKMLIYDTGGFFLAHRDTEKEGGMFGTLVITLPSAHRGGELIIRHAGREVAVDLSAGEISEVGFAAFYADCEHEVRPILEGNRVCLVYNLIHQRTKKTKGESPIAPDYEQQIATAAKLLEEHLHGPEAPAKIAWLLEHQYSPEGLSFAGLKSADAARSKVLTQAAERVNCAAHLGILHIEESGAAEPIYVQSRSRRYRDYEDEDEDSGDDDPYDVVEVQDWRHWVAEWRDLQDQAKDFGELPLAPGELLPAGALDKEEPDEQRLLEASGNAGVTFERSYHRAALVMWPRARYADVLLQAGIEAVLPYLRERIAAGDESAEALARKIITLWEGRASIPEYYRTEAELKRGEMLQLLEQLGNEALLQRFIDGVVTRDFDGRETEALARGFIRLGAAETEKLLIPLVQQKMPSLHRSCLELLATIMRHGRTEWDATWNAVLCRTAAVVVKALPSLKNPTHEKKAKVINDVLVADILDFLQALQAGELRTQAAAAMVQHPSVFDPASIIVPGLTLVCNRQAKPLTSDANCGRLWVHAAEFVLARSEQPPAPPTDWRQSMNLSCNCPDCRALQRFAQDAEAQVGRFRVRQDRRQHLHQKIEAHALDMSHVTERIGSPQTLVCTKTRRTYTRQREQHRADCASMEALLHVMNPIPKALSQLAARLAAAKERKSTPPDNTPPPGSRRAHNQARQMDMPGL